MVTSFAWILKVPFNEKFSYVPGEEIVESPSGVSVASGGQPEALSGQLAPVFCIVGRTKTGGLYRKG